MHTYSYKIMTDKGWSKRGVRVQAENAKEAGQLAHERYREKGYQEPMWLKWHYVK